MFIVTSISNTQNVLNFVSRPLPLKPRESEIWGIKDFLSLIFLMLGRVNLFA